MLFCFRYGFEKKRCSEAMQVCDGDVGLSLEYLLSECFPLDNSQVSTDSDMAEITELRNEEMLALEAIYEDKFVERIPGKVWVINLQLPTIDEIVKPKNSSKKFAPVTFDDKREICRFYLKGFCKFGRKCNMRHSVPAANNQNAAESDEAASIPDYTIEIRFPDGNLYPKSAPFIAFSSTSQFIEKHVCLNITKHMVNEALSKSEHEEPSIFSVVSLLDDEQFLQDVVREPPHEFSLPALSALWLNPNRQSDHMSDVEYVNQDSYTGNKDYEATRGDLTSDAKLASATNSMIKMTESDSRSSDSKNKQSSDDRDNRRVKSKGRNEERRPNPGEILKNNRKLIDEFKKKKVLSVNKGVLVVIYFKSNT